MHIKEIVLFATVPDVLSEPTETDVALVTLALVKPSLISSYVAWHKGDDPKKPETRVTAHAPDDTFATLEIIKSGLFTIVDAEVHETDPTPTLTTPLRPANTLLGIKGLGSPWERGIRVKVRSLSAVSTKQF